MVSVRLWRGGFLVDKKIFGTGVDYVGDTWDRYYWMWLFFPQICGTQLSGGGSWNLYVAQQQPLEFRFLFGHNFENSSEII